MKKPKSLEHRRKLSKAAEKRVEEDPIARNRISDWVKENGHPRIGMKHSEQAKEKMSAAATGKKYSKSVNAKKGRPGKIWISNDLSKSTMMIYPSDFAEFEKQGWYKGRSKYS